MAGVRHDVPVAVAIEQVEFLLGVGVFADCEASKTSDGFAVHGMSSAACGDVAVVENRETDELRTVELIRNCH